MSQIYSSFSVPYIQLPPSCTLRTFLYYLCASRSLSHFSWSVHCHYIKELRLLPGCHSQQVCCTLPLRSSTVMATIIRCRMNSAITRLPFLSLWVTLVAMGPDLARVPGKRSTATVECMRRLPFEIPRQLSGASENSNIPPLP